MASRLRDWIDDRTGYRTLLHALVLLNFPVSRAARWRYLWGGSLAFAFLAEGITGVLLMTVYSPSAASAWGSVYYIQYVLLPWGPWVRALHHYLSHLMIVLMLVHLSLIILTGAYRAPKEFTYWTGLILGLLVLALAVSGNPLPWDQKGYWAYQIETGILGTMPVVGPALRTLLVGGSEFGTLTLTRLYTLHVAVLPALTAVLLAGHIALVRRRCLAQQTNLEASEPYWPYQVSRNLTAFFVVLLVAVALIALRPVWKGQAADAIASQVAEDFPPAAIALEAPADPDVSYPARPEWHVRFLYELRHRVGKEQEVWVTAGLPLAVIALLVLMPFYERLLPLLLARGLAIGLVLGGLAGAAYLTANGWSADRRDPAYGQERRRAIQHATRALCLTELQSIPPEGAVVLLQRDPKTQGPVLLAAHCAACHRWDAHDGTGKAIAEPPAAPDLAGFGTAAWIRGFLESPASPRYLGHTKFKNGEMAKWSAEHMPKATPEEIAALLALLRARQEQVAAALAALEQENPPAPASPQQALLRRGIEVFRDGFAKDQEALDAGTLEGAAACNECHSLGPLAAAGQGGAPDLAGYASAEWLRGMIENPAAERYYGTRNDRMPAFRDRLTEQEITMLVRWMKGDWPRRAPLSQEPSR